MTTATRTCRHCNERVDVDDVFCETCGFRLQVSPPLDATSAVAAGATSRGRVREKNQDAFHVGEVAPAAYVVVCDGVSSSARADLAARVAATTAAGVLDGALRDAAESVASDPVAIMHAAIAEADQAVIALPLPSTSEGDAPSTTFVAALWDGNSVTVGSVGDSRAYWIGKTWSRRLTADDSWAQEQVDMGTMSEQAAMAAPDAHLITRWLGRDAPDGPFRVHSFQPSEPGVVIACSDGLWQYASSASELDVLVRSAPTAQPAPLAKYLVDLACALGGSDNVTVAVLDVEPHPSTGEVQR